MEGRKYGIRFAYWLFQFYSVKKIRRKDALAATNGNSRIFRFRLVGRRVRQAQKSQIISMLA
jgi:hypothetical protein